MKTILVPTDFSDHALFALKVAANIARKIKAEILLVHSYTMPTEEFYNSYIFEDLHKELKIMINKQLDSLISKDFLKDLTINKHMLLNMKLWEIATDIRFRDVDLIVMGSHGKSGFNDIFIGSNTEKVIRMTTSPVLTIKNEIENFNIKKMVFASNFYEESYTVFEKIKFFADLYKAHIKLLKIITPKDFESTLQSQNLINNFVEKFNLKDYSVNMYNAHNIEKGIIDFSDEINADIIAIETHGRTGFAHLINGSLAEDVVKHEVKPVLSIKIPSLSEPALKFMGKRIDYENWGNE